MVEPIKKNSIGIKKQIYASKNTKDIETFFIKTKKEIDKKIKNKVYDKEILKFLENGKHLRSILWHLSFKACTRGKETKSQTQKSLELSISIELAHSASLVNEDIIDNDVARRGKPAFHVKEGIGKTLLVGHKMLVQGFEIALSHSKEAAKGYMDSWDKIISGGIYEINFNKKDSINNTNNFQNKGKNEVYNEIIDLKTAGLFASACKAGALAADMPSDILKAFSNYGREIGLAYQLADDLVDLKNGEMIESVILPLLNRLENKSKTGFFKKRDIKKMFAKNEEKIKSYYIDEIKKHIKNAKKISQSHIIPESKYKKLMSEAPEYIINRMLSEINLLI
jgi:geranylgeranyl pyrophosphate synthase